MSNVESIQAVVAQLGKVKSEILGKIAALEAAQVAGEDLSAPLAELAAAAQALDDVVPDAVVEPAPEPAPEPVVEPAAPVEQVEPVVVWEENPPVSEGSSEG